MSKAYSVRELIIETQFQIERLDGKKRDGLSEQKILWRLNTAQDWLIKSWIKPDEKNPGRFLIDQKSNTDIQKIFAVNVPLQTIIDEDDRVYAYLPYNFRYLINDRSRLLENCKEEFEEAEDEIDYPRIVKGVKFTNSVKATSKYYTDINISIVKAGATTTRSLSTDGADSAKEKFEFVDYIIDQVRQMGFVMYWESFGSIYQADTFLLVCNLGESLNITINVDGTSLAGTSFTLPTVNIYKTDLDRDLMSRASNRHMKGDFLYDAMLHNYYDQPEPDSPVSHQADGKIYVHQSKRFLVSEVLIDYIRSPRRISLYLNQTCELDGSNHREVCSIAAEMYLGNIEAPNYITKVQENVNRLG